jgi:outer membrane biosynthesis protein TonB
VSSVIHPTSHRILVISAIVAAVAVTLCAMVAIAYMMGWLPSRTPQAAAISPTAALLPGETVVTPESTPAPSAPPPSTAAPSTPAPTTPNYSRTPPAVDPVARDPEPKPRPVPPPPAKRPPAPKTPPYAAAPPQPALCENCGTVTSTTAYPDLWEVRVRFQDGTSQVVRYRTPPNFRIGQRVRLEDGRLMRDY